ncbi:hypothetical protein [Nocardioides gilvus]|uniref:hypothetical protein n=1 Tax=Nocardioides gilvus TaxID=1735589 RepID=UPI000D749013|nr:hypothetical protein [Nocardioides gilvus]
MTIRQLGGLLGVAGGAAWVVRWMLVSAESDAAGLLRVGGLILILLGLVCVGLTLVKGQALWLDVVVGFAAPALFWALYEVVHTEVGASLLAHGVIGVVWAGVGGLLYARGGHSLEDEYEEA